MNDQFVPPEAGKNAFNCPQCNAFAHQTWHQAKYFRDKQNLLDIAEVRVSFCGRCSKPALWHGQQLIYPRASSVSMPNPDLPEDVKADYMEARLVAPASPRAAAALLRLSLQKLVGFLGESATNLNEGIAGLVRRGLPDRVRQALDVVRVIGNNAVHPGELDLKNDTETATHLFELVNIIGEYFISQPHRIDALYGRLPEGARAAIEKRDAPK